MFVVWQHFYDLQLSTSRMELTTMSFKLQQFRQKEKGRGKGREEQMLSSQMVECAPFKVLLYHNTRFVLYIVWSSIFLRKLRITSGGMLIILFFRMFRFGSSQKQTINSFPFRIPKFWQSLVRRAHFRFGNSDCFLSIHHKWMKGPFGSPPYLRWCWKCRTRTLNS